MVFFLIFKCVGLYIYAFKQVKHGRRKVVRHASDAGTSESRGVEGCVEECYDSAGESSGVAAPLLDVPASLSAFTQTQPVIVHQLGESCITYKSRSNAGTQTLDSLHDHNYNFKFSAKSVGTQTCRELTTFQICTEKDSIFYTGLSLTVFSTLVELMRVHGEHLPYSLSIKEQVLLTLVRLRLGLQFQDLGKRFEISFQLASRIFHSWINLLSDHLKDLILWLPKETIQRSMPKSFRETYPKTTCIIDCTEVYLQRPLSLKARTATYSNYKSHNTLKFLVCIAPNGYIMFLSKCYGGRASDKFITRKSGFYNYLQPNDEVMADRGFTIGEELFALRVNLNIPSFLRGRKQLTEKEVIESRRIASVRIHVERAIRRMKTYRILNSTVSIKSVKKMNKIVKVVGALCNLRPQLIRE